MFLGKQCAKLLGTNYARKKMLDFLDASIRWDEDESATFDLHFSFGKISLDKHNRLVDRGKLRTD